MKHNFMNKENGKIASVLVMYLDDDGHMQTDSYDKVEDLLEDYGAYVPDKPKPLIKDEKIRKAVRAWAEANGRDSFKVVNEHFNCCKIIGYTQNGIADGGSRIEFGTTIAGAKQKYFYTIAELCGEEE